VGIGMKRRLRLEQCQIDIWRYFVMEFVYRQQNIYFFYERGPDIKGRKKEKRKKHLAPLSFHLRLNKPGDI